MTFPDVVMECFDNAEFVHHFNRLMGCSVAVGGITGAVDEATGKRGDDLRKFVEFVREYIWERLP